MKTHVKLLFLGVLFALFCCISLSSYADGPPPPIVPEGHGLGGNVPVGAPIDNGVIILLALGVGYAAFKLYSARKAKADEILN